METIAELRKICQTAPGREMGNIYARRFIRFFSIFLTRFLLPHKISANQVSLLMIFVGVFSTCLFLFPFRWSFCAGALLMQLWYTLDGVDGEVARYRYYQKTGSIVMDKRDGSLTGMYLDMINHYIINLLVPATIAFGVFQKTGASGWILVGIAASLAQVLMLAMHDARSRAQLTHLKRFSHIEVLSTKKGKGTASSNERSLAHLIFIALHNTLTYPAVMNWVGIAGVLSLFHPAIEWRSFLLLYLALGTAIVSATLIAQSVNKHLNEEEFQNDFQVSDTKQN